MRAQGQAKLGFYPLPPAEAKRLKNSLSWAGGRAAKDSVVDGRSAGLVRTSIGSMNQFQRRSIDGSDTLLECSYAINLMELLVERPSM